MKCELVCNKKYQNYLIEYDFKVTEEVNENVTITYRGVATMTNLSFDIYISGIHNSLLNCDYVGASPEVLKGKIDKIAECVREKIIEKLIESEK